MKQSTRQHELLAGRCSHAMARVESAAAFHAHAQTAGRTADERGSNQIGWNTRTLQARTGPTADLHVNPVRRALAAHGIKKGCG